MDADETVPLEDEPGPDWKERLGAAKRAAKALLATRAAIFREEIAQKGADLGKAALWLSLGVAFALLSLVLLAALSAAVLIRLLGGPIAGLAGAFFLYLLIAGAVGYLGMRALSRVRPFDFPVTRDEVAKDLEAIREEPEVADEGPASDEALAAERASITGEEDDLEEDVVEEQVIEDSDLEQRFRAGSE
jgi:uncharacterized membrane protein YqjE